MRRLMMRSDGKNQRTEVLPGAPRQPIRGSGCAGDCWAPAPRPARRTRGEVVKTTTTVFGVGASAGRCCLLDAAVTPLTRDRLRVRTQTGHRSAFALIVGPSRATPSAIRNLDCACPGLTRSQASIVSQGCPTRHGSPSNNEPISWIRRQLRAIAKSW